MANLGGQGRTEVKKGPAEYRGFWWIQFVGEDDYALFKGDLAPRHVAVRGTVAYSGKRITFTDRRGRLACKGSKAVGVYRYAFVAATRMRLTLISDQCRSRRAVFAGHTFQFFGAAG